MTEKYNTDQMTFDVAAGNGATLGVVPGNVEGRHCYGIKISKKGSAFATLVVTQENTEGTMKDRYYMNGTITTQNNFMNVESPESPIYDFDPYSTIAVTAQGEALIGELMYYDE